MSWFRNWLNARFVRKAAFDISPDLAFACFQYWYNNMDEFRHDVWDVLGERIDIEDGGTLIFPHHISAYSEEWVEALFRRTGLSN